METKAEKLKIELQKIGQGHVFKFWDSLEISEKTHFLNQLQEIDLNYIKHAQKLIENVNNTNNNNINHDVKPIPDSLSFSKLNAPNTELDKYEKIGLSLIYENKVAIILMAGGQGTRLGSSQPKGCYDINLPSHKSLFQLQAERILKIQSLSIQMTKNINNINHNINDLSKQQAIVPWYIMTSEATHDDTIDFFKKHNYFGISHENIFFFKQGNLPTFDTNGKILLENKSKISVSPDGNGGLYLSLLKSGALNDMKTRGIEHLHVYAVDNCLVKVADPIFIGFSASKNLKISSKVVRKTDPSESVGLIVSFNSKPKVIEYSEISSDLRDQYINNKDQTPLLKFRSANIVNHYFSFSFLSTIPDWDFKNYLPYHLAFKKIPHIDVENNILISKPQKPNGYKLEQFVFDVFSQLSLKNDEFAIFEVERSDEFSVLKNPPGSKSDCPETSKHDLLAQGQRWLTAVGAKVIDSDTDDVDNKNIQNTSHKGIEVPPLLSYSGEGLEFLNGRVFKSGTILSV